MKGPLETALALASAGVPVFWCKPDKSPREKGGFKNATIDQAKIAAQFAKWPDSLLGVPTGRASGLSVVDFDPTGIPFYESRTDWGGTRTNKTRRGVHLVYHTKKQAVKTSASKLAPGVDVRGDGGYVIWWPAHGYATEGKALPLPAWLAELILKKESAAPEPATVAANTSTARLRSLLALHDADGSYDMWIKAGMSLHAATEGGPDGLTIWDEWSKTSKANKYPSYDELAAKYASFTAGSITADWLAIGKPAVAEDFEPIEEAPAPLGDRSPAVQRDMPPMKRDKNGRILATISNAVTAAKTPHLNGYHLGNDVFKGILLQAPADGGADDLQPFEDPHYTRMRVNLEHAGFDPINSQMMRDAVLDAADCHQFDSAQLWLERLKWDGKERVPTFLSTYFGAEDTAYTRAVSEYLWTALAGRIIQPGVKADMMPILVGPQGARKSSGVAALVSKPEQFVEIDFRAKDEDMARRIVGRLVGEVGELRGLQTGDLDQIKSFITRTHETWIPKYIEFAKTYPRRIVLIGTTNKKEFLGDETGERRFLPVHVQRGNTDLIEKDRDNLWAEGRQRFKLHNGVYFADAEKLGADVVTEFKQPDMWSEIIQEWLEGSDDLTDKPRKMLRPSTRELATQALGFDPRNVTRAHEMRISKILRVLGYELKVLRINGLLKRAWTL